MLHQEFLKNNLVYKHIIIEVNASTNIKTRKNQFQFKTLYIDTA